MSTDDYGKSASPAANVNQCSAGEPIGQAQGLSPINEPAVPKVLVALSSSAAETLRCLFFHGPTWDGNVPSKSGRDELVDMKLAARGSGWQWLTQAGVDACFANGIEREKNRRESAERRRRGQLEEAARGFLG